PPGASACATAAWSNPRPSHRRRRDAVASERADLTGRSQLGHRWRPGSSGSIRARQQKEAVMFPRRGPGPVPYEFHNHHPGILPWLFFLVLVAVLVVAVLALLRQRQEAASPAAPA